MGCIEFIFLVFVFVIVCYYLGKLFECIEVKVLLNLMKNGMGVIVLNMGMVGFLMVVVIGVIGGDY